MAISTNNSNTPGVPAPQPKSSGFVNLGRILGANVNNRLSGAISSGLNQGSNQVQQNLQQIGGQFQNQSNQANLASDANKQVRQQALQNIGSGNTNVDDNLKSQFEQFRSGQYAGPKELDPTQTAQVTNKANELQGYGNALRGGGDKSQVLQAFAGKGNYTQGQQKLDSLLLGKGPNAQQELGEARKSVQGLGKQVGQAQNNAQQTAQLRASQAEQFGKDTNAQLTAANTAQQTALNDKLVAAQKNQALYQKVANGENLTPDEITSLNAPQNFEAGGGTLDTATLLKNLSTLKPLLAANGFQNFNTGIPDQSSVASTQDLAKAQALSQLSGTPQGLIAQEGQVGKYVDPKFDIGQFTGGTPIDQTISGHSDLMPGTPGYGAELDRVNSTRRVFGLPPLNALTKAIAPGGSGAPNGQLPGGFRS